MCGLPFSGKSTLSRAIARLTGSTRIAMDEINDERGVGLNGAPISPQQWEETYREMYTRVREALSKGESVVLDSPSFNKEQRREVEAIASACQAASCIVYVKVPASEVTRRWQDNRRTGERHDVRDDNFELGLANFEPPDESEKPLVYDQSTSPEEWVRSTIL